MIMASKKGAAKNKYTSVLVHFYSHGGAPEQHRWHHLMRHVQGYPESHWTPPSGDYLLRIALAAARATANETMTKKWTNFAGHFDGPGGVPVQYHGHCPMEEVQGFGRSHWTPPLGEYCDQQMQSIMHKPVFFKLFSL
jgi:hypothetical protein